MHDLLRQTNYVLYRILYPVDVPLIIMIAIFLGLFCWWGLHVGGKSNGVGKIWFLLLMALAIILDHKQPNLLILAPVVLAVGGFIWALARPVRERNAAARLQNKNTKQQGRADTLQHKRAVELTRASQQTIVLKEAQNKTTLKSILLQSTGMIITFVFTKVVLGHGTTEAAMPSLIAAAVIGLIFNRQA